MDSSCDVRTGSESETSPLMESGSPEKTSRYQRSLSASPFPHPSIFTRAVICILVTELCERLTYYGISGNLQLFVSDKDQLNYSPQIASIIAYIFQGTCFLLPVLGGWLADSIAGKFSVILFSCIIYLVGTMLLPLGSISDKDPYVQWATTSFTTNKIFKGVVYLCGLALVAMGTGGIKANVSPFGAEQVLQKGPEGVQKFFIWFYWFINIGAILAFTFVVYVQQNISYFYGYLIPTCAIVITLIIFLAGKSSYQIRHPTGSVLTTTLKIVTQAVKRSRSRTWAGEGVFVQHWLDRAKQNLGGSYNSWEVEDVKKVYRLIPIFCTFILYWMVYAQMNTSMVYQGEYMDIKLSSNFQIPIASLSVLDTIAVLTFIPIMDKLVYPLLGKCNIRLSKLQRIGIGMMITTMSMVCAGVIEMFRTHHCCMEQHRPHNGNLTISNVTILYQVPQYALIGLSEVFTSVSGLELAYAEAPQQLQGVVMGVFLLTTGLGMYLGAGVVAVVNAISGSNGIKNKWYPDKKHINDGKLAYYFFLLGGMMALNCILYVFVALSFKASKAAAVKTPHKKRDINSSSTFPVQN